VQIVDLMVGSFVLNFCSGISGILQSPKGKEKYRLKILFCNYLSQNYSFNEISIENKQ
jgi:hypothetical protein